MIIKSNIQYFKLKVKSINIVCKVFNIKESYLNTNGVGDSMIIVIT